MIELIDKGLRNTFGVRLAGTVDQAEYQATLPRVTRLMEKGTRLNFVCEIDTEAEIEPSVVWDDMKFGLAHASRIGRVAVVGGDKWQPLVEIMEDERFTARLFPPEETAAAWAWAAGGEG